MRRMLERKARDNAIREANATKKLVDRLLAKRTRKVVPSYRDKALVSSGTGTGLFRKEDAEKLAEFLRYHYLDTRATK